MKATVVVSCYKQERYIQDCLDSILNQKVDFDFDILISDDASPDSTPVILRNYANNFPEKISLILRRRNVGAAKNYIDAHNKAEGDVIFHFDGDDIMLPGKLQKQFDIFKAFPEVNIVFHRARYFSDNRNYEAETGSPSFLNEGNVFFDAKDLALWGSITVHSAYAYRKKSRKTRMLDKEFMEWFFAMDSLLPQGKAAYLDEILVEYRCNVDGGAYLSSRAGRIKSYDIYFQDVKIYFDGNIFLRKELYANYLFTAMARLRAKCGFSTEMGKFLFGKIFYLRPALLLKVYKMRKSVAPSKRVR